MNGYLSNFPENMKEVKRGDVFYVYKTPPFHGSREIYTKEGRPAVVVSRDEDNLMSGTVMVAYFTGNKNGDRTITRDTQFEILNGRCRNSICKCEQLDTVDRLCLGDYVNSLSGSELEDLDRCVRIATGTLDSSVTPVPVQRSTPITSNSNEGVNNIEKLEKELIHSSEELKKTKQELEACKVYKTMYNEILNNLLNRKPN